MYESGALEALSQAECRHLLRETRIGRFVFWDRTHYAVHPVRYICEDDARILFRTENGAKVEVGSRRQDVSVEIDHIDPVNGHGWSVVASGPASHITDPYQVEHVLSELPQPWASDAGREVVCVYVDYLEGRRFQAPAFVP
jgi:nitroimidazol reductase NimA-like FMN-containing flavoprotein (pyridoxamine 5'-phosphate oxidase superfamily)